jgi:hypothetical protein
MTSRKIISDALLDPGAESTVSLAGRRPPALRARLTPGAFLAVFDSLRARLDRLFAEQGADPRARTLALREALVEAKLGLDRMREALGATDHELTAERKRLEDAERRGRLAAQVPDAETVAVAERFAMRHRERLVVLTRKLEVQRDELALAERELEEMAGHYRASNRPDVDGNLRAAWREVEAAGGVRPETDLESELLRAQTERRLMEEAVEAQLAQLKKKLGKQ